MVKQPIQTYYENGVLIEVYAPKPMRVKNKAGPQGSRKQTNKWRHKRRAIVKRWNKEDKVR